MDDSPIEMPPFASDLLKKQKCPFCKELYRHSDVVMQGHRRGSDGDWYYCFEIYCSDCKQPSLTIVTSRPMRTKEYMLMLSSLYQSGEMNSGDGEQPKNPSCITDEEVARAKQIMEECESWDDVLFQFGLTKEQYKKYLREGEEEDNNGNDH